MLLLLVFTDVFVVDSRDCLQFDFLLCECVDWNVEYGTIRIVINAELLTHWNTGNAYVEFVLQISWPIVEIVVLVISFSSSAKVYCTDNEKSIQPKRHPLLFWIVCSECASDKIALKLYIASMRFVSLYTNDARRFRILL